MKEISCIVILVTEAPKSPFTTQHIPSLEFRVHVVRDFSLENWLKKLTTIEELQDKFSTCKKIFTVESEAWKYAFSLNSEKCNKDLDVERVDMSYMIFPEVMLTHEEY